MALALIVVRRARGNPDIIASNFRDNLLGFSRKPNFHAISQTHVEHGTPRTKICIDDAMINDVRCEIEPKVLSLSRSKSTAAMHLHYLRRARVVTFEDLRHCWRRRRRRRRNALDSSSTARRSVSSRL